MDSNHPHRRQKKKSARKKEGTLPIFDSKLVAHLRRQLDDRLPNLSRQIASLMRASREKLGDVYSSAAQVVIEHKEAFEDRLAERKAQARAATRAAPQQEVPARPIRPGTRRTAKDGTAKKSAAYRSSAKPRS
jgi:hypothetical protein